jgi:dTDP-4-dehydrorhamnose reductase
MNWLLLGANGQLGRCLQDVLTIEGIPFVACDRSEVDIRVIDSIEDAIIKSTPVVIVNAAAWTDVDGAETHQTEAYAINALGAENVARVASKYDVPLVHISTDYVFDGSKRSPYLTNDTTNPLSVYGQTKLEGEIRVRTVHPSGSWIIRTAWLYSPYGKNFARTIARKALLGEDLKVVNDSIGQPTSAHALARQVVRLVSARPPAGTFHGTNSGKASWYDFASAIVSPLDSEVSLTAVSSDIFPTIASRPKYSVLDHSNWSANRISTMPPWNESLSEVLPAIIQSVKESDL